MFKKILSATLVLAMALTVVGALQMTSFASDKVTYADFPGTKTYETEFSTSGYGGNRWIGISNGSIAGAGYFRQDNAVGSTPGNFLLTSKTQANGAAGTTLEARTVMGYSYASRAELDARNTGDYKVIVNGSPVNAFYYRFVPSVDAVDGVVGFTYTPTCTETNDIHYLITIDALGLKTWYPITATGDLDADGNLVPGTYAYDASLVPTSGVALNKWFTPMWNGAPVMYSGGGTGKNIGLTPASNTQKAYISKADLSYTKQSVATTVDGKDVGTVVWSFDVMNDFSQLSGSGVPAGSTTFRLFGNLQMIMQAGKVIPTSSQGITVNDANKSRPNSGVQYIGKNADVEGTKDNASDLVAYPAYAQGKWTNVMVVYNLETSVFKYYVDGKPVYTKLADGKYYDEYYCAHTTGTFKLLNTFCVEMPYNERYIENSFFFDNFKVKYIADTSKVVDSTVLVKSALSSKGPDWTEDLAAYQGFAIEVNNLPASPSKMIWVFNTADVRRFSEPVELTAAVDVTGPVKFGVVIKNGDAAEGNVAKDYDEVIGVDAIFGVNDETFFTNIIDINKEA